MKISVRANSGYLYNVPVKLMTFSGGEQHVKIDVERLKDLLENGERVVVQAEVRSSADLMELVMVKNALDHILQFVDNTIELVMLYVPYARQDRVCDTGEAFGLEAFAHILNSLNFVRVTVADPHSDVTSALIQRLNILPQDEIAFEMLKWKLHQEKFALVAPDAGALKKIYKLGTRMGLPVFCAEKIRDVSTGAIVRTDISVTDFAGQNLMIIDDIADNGGTFIALGKMLKERNAGKVELYVTHGIFGKGLDVFQDAIDTVHCFNLWNDNAKDSYKRLVLNQTEVQEAILNDKLFVH